VNKWWGPPGEADDDPEHGFDAWFDVWIEEDGSLGTYLGRHDDALPVATLKAAMQNGLQDLLSGRTKRLPHSRNPSTEIDLGQAVLLVRVVHQRNGAVSCGWARFAADPHLLRPLHELAAIASAKLTEQPVGPPA
jgi:hypothetical protein